MDADEFADISLEDLSFDEEFWNAIADGECCIFRQMWLEECGLT